jgi:peptide/nickel transport system substrate-binding protein
MKEVPLLQNDKGCLPQAQNHFIQGEKMKIKHLYYVVSLLVVLSMALASCAPQAATPSQAPAVQTDAPVATEAPTEAATEAAEPTEPPTTRTGAWVDEVVFTKQDTAEAAASQLASGDLDIYAYTVAEAPVYESVKANDNLDTTPIVGSNNSLMFNPVEFSNGKLNPFVDRELREAMNYLVDRNYVVQEIYKGLAFPKYTPLTTVFPDYARYIDIARNLETKYAYDKDKADQIISARMEALGATRENDKWTYNGEPVTLILLIRTEDNRRAIGDYFANQLESIGFTVDRQYKTRTEASPIWGQSDPAEGLWHIYTAGNINTQVGRDEGTNFSAYYTPRAGPSPIYQSYTPSPEFDEAALALEGNQFSTLEERRQLFDTALRLSLEDSVRIWVVDEASFSPRVKKLSIASDLAGGAEGSQIWGQTVRFEGQEGGSVRIAQPGILVDPWNPLSGSNWIYDSMPQRGTSDNGVIADPFTGLSWPQRMERAEVVAKEGLPMSKTLDWVDLSFQPEVQVPADTWIDWDAANQKFITVGEKYPDGLTSNTRVTVYYPDDLFDTVTWHDGSPLSPADFVMNMIQVFDQAKPESEIYDEATVPGTEGFQTHFKGVRVVSTDPLVIETYDDTYQLDAETLISNFGLYPNPTWWPQYAYGEAPWHTIALGYLAEANKELAFSTDKAGALSVEWMNFISGPSLEILKKYLDQADGESFIPYAATLGQYITADQAKTRYDNLEKFYADHNHFWVNSGPFVLDKVFPVEDTLTLKRYDAYGDNAGKWNRFGKPKTATVELDGAGQVQSGSEAVFDVYVENEGEPYPSAEIAEVKYLLSDAKGNLVNTGQAEALEDGHYQITLPADVTSKLEAGSNKLEVVVVSSVVSIPAFASYEFVTTK